MENLEAIAHTAPTRGHGMASLSFLASVGFLLLTVVEMRRAFLFPISDYLKIGAPSAILVA